MGDGHKYTIDKLLQGIICFLLCLECQKIYIHHIFSELCESWDFTKIWFCDTSYEFPLVEIGHMIKVFILKIIPWVMQRSYWSIRQRHNRIHDRDQLASDYPY